MISNDSAELSEFAAGGVSVPYPIDTPSASVQDVDKNDAVNQSVESSLPKYTSVEHPKSAAFKAVILDDRSHFSKEMTDELKLNTWYH